MHTPFTCPRCGASSELEILRFFDDDGRARIRITCRLIVHEQPVVQEIEDPDIPRASELSPSDGLVHDLDLYNKLEDVVHRLDQPAEYGVVEHHFAMAYPDEYLTLWRKHGHVATHGSKRYTVSAYLSRLLGNLTRHGSVAHRSCVGTGRWAYNSGVSAWASPHRADQPILSWEDFARANGWDPHDWPAADQLPDDEYPTRADPAAASSTRHLDPEPLIIWLQTRAPGRGAARRQPAIPLTVDWESAIASSGSAGAKAAMTRVSNVATVDGLTRPNLFALADQHDWEALHLAVLIWGYGRFANLTHTNAVKAYAATNADNRAEICEKVRTDTYIAWSRWWPADRQSTMPGLRVPMGTKLLYFAGYDSDSHPKPLIYDQRVHAQLSDLGYQLAHPQGRRQLVRWKTQYRPYLDLCAEAAQALALEPDDVEYELFNAAGR